MSSVTRLDTVPRVRPVSAAICARERDPVDATCRRTTPRLARRTVVWSAGRPPPPSKVVERGRSSGNRVSVIVGAVCMEAAQTKLATVLLSTSQRHFRRRSADQQARPDGAARVAQLGQRVRGWWAEERVAPGHLLDPLEPLGAEPLAETAAENDALHV